MDYAIILGGGKGLRMGADIPKQFIEIGGLPILMRTILRFREYGDVCIILVLPKDQQNYWQHLCQVHHFTEDYQIADGGSERFFSIKNALALIPDDARGVVAVHDGVRPFPSVEVIARCFETARQTGSAVPVIPVVETIRHIEPIQPQAHLQPFPKGGEPGGCSGKSNCSLPIGRAGGGSSTVPRSEYRLVQTPQAFDIQLHKQAYRQPFNDGFTDDASVVEAYWLKTPLQLPQGGESKSPSQEASPRGGLEGVGISLVEGNRENIKITTPFDLIVAEALVSSQEKSGKGAHV